MNNWVLILLVLVFLLMGCATKPVIQYQYVCRDIYLSEQMYNAATAQDINVLYEYAIWCGGLKNGI